MSAWWVAGSAAPPYRFLRELFPATHHRRLWLVGGTVRDALLCRPIKDLDLVAALSAQQLESLGFRPVTGKTTGSIWLRHFPGAGNVEITRIAAPGELLADLQRRDFTVNAMVLTLAGELMDPLGGKADLDTRLLRPCRPDSFRRDPLRLFRACRFTAEGFVLSAAAAAQMRGHDWETELQSLPVERFSREMLKALAAAAPDRFFRALLEFSLGRQWLPELFRMPQIVAGPLHHHPEGDLLSHSLDVLDRVVAVSDAPLARFCALFHDLGKLATDPAHYPRHHGHEEAGYGMAHDFCRRLALPLTYGRALAQVCRLHGHANRFAQLRLATRIRMAEGALKGGVDELLPLIAAADKPGSDIAAAWQQTVAVARLTCRELGIGEGELASLEADRRAGLILQRKVTVLRGSGRFHPAENGDPA